MGFRVESSLATRPHEKRQSGIIAISNFVLPHVHVQLRHKNRFKIAMFPDHSLFCVVWAIGFVYVNVHISCLPQ